ncbi:MAG: glycine--tRNA ligase subunit beta [Chthonomonadales bacterium]|nr:glycine--tRNA ligase subunit beta [Chthonomonadales bacterium]
MPDLALEIGTEEMPAGAVAAAAEQLRSAVEAALGGARLGAERVSARATPRRLIVTAGAVPRQQPDLEREVRGPSRAVAFDPMGRPTGAAQGFARKQGVPVEALSLVETPQGEYVAARLVDRGRPAAEVLGPLLAEAARGLAFPKMMRWGQDSPRFVRPIRWILALLGEEVVPLQIAGVRSGRQSRGHRYLAPAPFDVPSAGDLLPRLLAARVLCDADKRRGAIREQADALARSAGGSVPWDEGLLDENTYLVEWPTALMGRFDPAYLELPRPVLVTAMKKHQRFFPVQDAGGRLMPLFISVRNGGDRGLDIVRAGNERVLTARFADARYFYAHDRDRSLESMAEGLGRLIFQEKLGTLAEKRRRLELLAGALADSLGMEAAERARAVRAASLAKADLTSQMVVELPSLQGIMGREYALLAGEEPAVADAIAEHYLPRSAGDTLPATPIGRILAVADRLDTLVGYVGLGILPSGSSDPYGLRRAAQGVVQILAEEPAMPGLAEIQAQAASAYRQVNGAAFELDPLCNDLAALFAQRLGAYLDEAGVRYDLVEAALSGGFLYGTVVYGAARRARFLQEVAQAPDFVATVKAAARVASILRSADEAAAAAPVPGKEAIHGGSARSVERAVSILESEGRRVSRGLLAEPAETALYVAACALLADVARCAAGYAYADLYRTLGALRDPVNRFFDDVLVMVDDALLRRNRLALLSFVDTLFKTLADFNRVVVPGA